MMTGPGAITTVIVLANDGGSALHYVVLFAVVALVVSIIYAVFMSGERLLAFIGEDGNNVLLRIMGLILMVLAVEFIIGGMTPILREIFQVG
jgi:multiple antibiotic resistance protein